MTATCSWILNLPITTMNLQHLQHLPHLSRLPRLPHLHRLCSHNLAVPEGTTACLQGMMMYSLKHPLHSRLRVRSRYQSSVESFSMSETQSAPQRIVLGFSGNICTDHRMILMRTYRLEIWQIILADSKKSTKKPMHIPHHHGHSPI